jgi:hypothetical protein
MCEESIMKLGTTIALSLAVLGIVAPVAPAQAVGSGIEIGILTCSVVPGSRVNLILRSTADVTCEFSHGGVTERYKGETGIALGLDLSIKSNERMAFTVISASTDIGTYALAGRYVGGEIAAEVGLGLGAKALIGGGAHSIGLQPVALETSTGLGASAGLAFLYLEPFEGATRAPQQSGPIALPPPPASSYAAPNRTIVLPPPPQDQGPSSHAPSSHAPSSHAPASTAPYRPR